jgi:Zn-dependent protease with chaperone function
MGKVHPGLKGFAHRSAPGKIGAVNREEIDALIRRLEGISREHPRLYVARLVGLILLAYGYLLLLLLGSLALSLIMLGLMAAAPATIHLAIVGLIAFGSLFLAVLRGLWVRLEPPKGQALSREEAPRLYELLDGLRRDLDCRPFHRVVLVGDINAGVVQIPRLGVFGWHRNHLVLGLPLLECLTPEEFKAVLAHEFAHSSRGHGRFGNWLYRVRRTWEQVFALMARRQTRWAGVLSRFVTGFIGWFWPRFHAHSFVLARANEYVADACSVRMAGAEITGSALVRTRLGSLFLGENFWPNLWARAKETGEPPTEVFAELRAALRHGPASEDAARWLRQSLLLETNNADTHPCLKDRLRAIGQPAEAADVPIVSFATNDSATEHYLGELAATVTRRLSDEWQAAIRPQWQARHAHAKKLAEELANSATSELPPKIPEIWERARKLVELHGDEAATTLLEQILTLEPRHAGANFILGRRYLQADDPRGIQLVESAMTADYALTLQGCQLLHAHFNRTGQRDRLRPLENRADEFNKLASLAQQERAQIMGSDGFEPSGLSASQIDDLRKVFSGEAAIGSAAVARKQVRHFPHSPCFAIALKLRVPWWKLRRAKTNQQLVQRVIKQVRLPGHFSIFVAEHNLIKLGRKVYAVPEAIIYERPEAK